MMLRSHMLVMLRPVMALALQSSEDQPPDSVASACVSVIPFIVLGVLCRGFSAGGLLHPITVSLTWAKAGREC